MAFKAFDRTVSFAPGSADSKWVEGELARFALESLREAQAEGAASEQYLRTVNGRRNAPEASVRAPGPIVYTFDHVRDAAIYALEFLRVTAPKRTGRFSRSFIVIADGREVPPARIPMGARVLIVNTQPYARKIQVGAKGFESRRGFFDVARRRTQAQFRGLVKVRTIFVRLSDGYRLKRSAGRRRDSRAGSEINYPALELLSETIVAN